MVHIDSDHTLSNKALIVNDVDIGALPQRARVDAGGHLRICNVVPRQLQIVSPDDDDDDGTTQVVVVVSIRSFAIRTNRKPSRDKV